MVTALKKMSFILVIILALSACSLTKGKEFDSLTEQARIHVDNLDYQAAADVYSKALEVKEDATARSELTKLNSNIAEIRDIKKILGDLKESAGAYKNVLSSADLLEMCDDLTDKIARLDNFDTSRNSPAANYVRGLRDSTDYFGFTSSIETARIYRLVGGREGHDTFTDAKNISDSLDSLLTSFPVPEGFSTIK